jgi:O-antigen/teichoic acid export membrane protein
MVIAWLAARLRFTYLVVISAPLVLFFWWWGATSELILLLLLLAANLFARTVVDFVQAAFRGVHRYRPLLLLEILSGTALLASGAAFLFQGFGLLGLLFAEFASSSLAAGVALILAPSSFGPLPSLARSLPGMARATAAFNAYPFVVHIYDRMDIVLLAQLAGNAAAGFYGLAYRVLSGFQIVPFGLMGALLPLISGERLDGPLLNRLRHLMALLYSGALLVVLASVLLAEPVILLLGGEPYRNSILVLQVLMWALIPMFLNYFLNTLLLVAGHEKLMLRAALVCALINLVANLLLIPRFTYLAAAAITIVTECALLAQNLVLLRRVLRVALLPAEFMRHSAAFVVLLGTSWVAMRFLSPVPVALGASLAFGLFLFTAGRVKWQSALSLHSLG